MRCDFVGRRGFAAAAARTAAAAAPPTGRRSRRPSSTRKPKNRRSAAERRATVDGASSRPLLAEPRQIVGRCAARAIRRALPPRARGRCDRRRACGAKRPLRPPSCRGSGRPAPRSSAVTSRPGQRLGGDHPRGEILAGAAQAPRSRDTGAPPARRSKLGVWNPVPVEDQHRPRLPAAGGARRSSGSSSYVPPRPRP